MTIEIHGWLLGGWMLREHEDPTAVPCLYRGQWVLLTDDGQLVTTTSTPEEAQ